jgi:nucleoside 2-deoxyribosyltransferase
MSGQAVSLGPNYIFTKQMPKVYLAGPISGLTYDQGQDWRALIASQLQQRGILGYSPLRAKAYLKAFGALEQSYQAKEQPLSCLSSDRGITSRDRWDVMTSDAILFNFLGAERVSIGTCIEIGWADAFRKPCVVVMEPEGNLHDYPMIREIAGWRVPTLNDGVLILDRILNPQLEENRRG